MSKKKREVIGCTQQEIQCQELCQELKMIRIDLSSDLMIPHALDSRVSLYCFLY